MPNISKADCIKSYEVKVNRTFEGRAEAQQEGKNEPTYTAQTALLSLCKLPANDSPQYLWAGQSSQEEPEILMRPLSLVCRIGTVLAQADAPSVLVQCLTSHILNPMLWSDT